jgi:AcrR family transcriptional regulator
VRLDSQDHAQPKPAAREALLDAAAAIMREHGIARTRTRNVAQRAGYSEATMYKHFADKTDLMLAVLRERSTAFTQLAAALADHSGSVEEALARIARAAIAFYVDSFPMLASIFADPQVLDAHKDALKARGLGPHHVNEAVADYLRSEVDAGRIGADADLYAGAGLLVGACMQHAFLGHMGWPDQRPSEAAAQSFARTALAGLG